MYETEKNARACEAQPFTPKFHVGDIVIAGEGRYGWYDGDPHWVIEEKKYSDEPSQDRFTLLYIVTAIMNKPGVRDGYHEVAYCLATLAMDAETGYSSGWTMHTGSHYTPRLAVLPVRQMQYVKRTGARLIGMTTTRLL